MKTFALRDGDFVLAPSGYGLVEANAKLRQDLGVALSEPYGCDRFHPRWGSLLPSYVGGPIDAYRNALVVGEADRIVTNYMAMQVAQLDQDAVTGNPSRFGAGEVISKVNGVDTKTQTDKILVKINLTTMSGDQIMLSRILGGT